MKTGIELITLERQEQIKKHSRPTERDAKENDLCQLSEGASWLLYQDWQGCADTESIIEDHKPQYWDENIWAKMVNKSYKERLIIAGALIAAEIDRLQFNETNP